MSCKGTKSPTLSLLIAMHTEVCAERCKNLLKRIISPFFACMACQMCVSLYCAYMQRDSKDRTPFPQALSEVKQYIFSNDSFITGGKELLESIAHAHTNEGDQGSAAASSSMNHSMNQATSQHISSHPSTAPSSSSSEDGSACSVKMTVQEFDKKCEQLAWYIDLCSESCIDVLRHNYLLGALQPALLGVSVEHSALVS